MAPLALVLSFAVFALHGLFVAAYLASPHVLDHLQSSVLAIGWASVQGAPVYPDFLHAEAYGLLYGPLLFLANGAFLTVFPSIAAGKALGALVWGLSCFFFAAALQRSAGGYRTALCGLALYVLAADAPVFAHFAVTNLADAFINLLVALALGSLSGAPNRLRFVWLGLLAGLATGFKAHGALYVAPIGLALWIEQISLSPSTIREPVISALLAFATFAAVAIAPFALWSSVDAGAYLQYLAVGGRHGLGAKEILDNALAVLEFGAPLALGFAFKWKAGGDPLDARTRFLSTSFAVCIALSFIPASKEGAGPHHFLPFAAIYACLWIVLLRATWGNSRARALVAGCLVLIAVPGGLLPPNGVFAFSFNRAEAAAESEKVLELIEFVNRAPGATVEPAGLPTYRDALYYPEAVFHGASLRFDRVSWDDLRLAGVDEGAVTKFLVDCRVPAWIFPLGEPFSIESYYTGRPLFSDEFHRAFAANYELAATGRHYQLWTCRGRQQANGLRGSLRDD